MSPIPLPLALIVFMIATTAWTDNTQTAADPDPRTQGGGSAQDLLGFTKPPAFTDSAKDYKPITTLCRDDSGNSFSQDDPEFATCRANLTKPKPTQKDGPASKR